MIVSFLFSFEVGIVSCSKLTELCGEFSFFSFSSFFGLSGLPAAAIEPVPESSVSTVEERTSEQRERWWKMGLKAISEGKLAVVLLSGGQVGLIKANNHILSMWATSNQSIIFC